MIIELQHPFKDLWLKGYLVTNKEPRRNIILYNSNTDRTTISYARYLMSVYLGRFLSDDEVVDHINADKLDDRLENYQIITHSENISKRYQDTNMTELLVDIRCGVCGYIFTKPRNNTHLLASNKKQSTFCSRSCAGKSTSLKAISEVLNIYRR